MNHLLYIITGGKAMLHYVTLRHAQGKVASIVVDLPEDYAFMPDGPLQAA